MGSITVASTGKAKGTLTYTTTYSGGKGVVPLPYTYAYMLIESGVSRSASHRATGGTSSADWQFNQPATLSWNLEISTQILADCLNCQWHNATYKIIYQYAPPGSSGPGAAQFYIVETGSITGSGILPCDLCGDGGDGGGGGDDDGGGGGDGGGDGGGGGESPYGPATPGEIPREPAVPTSDPCLPPQPTAPNPPVPTPCGGGSGTGPGSFS